MNGKDVEVGRRYVVGPDPTWFWRGVPMPHPTVKEGDIVTAQTDRPDSAGEVGISPGSWIFPRHLTPADEPEEPATVDETPAALRWKPGFGPADSAGLDDDLLRDLCTEVRMSYGVDIVADVNYLRAVLASELFQRLRAAWTAEVARERDRISAEGKRLQQERDEARAEADRNAKDCDDRDGALHDLLAENERLRARPELPDVEVHREGENFVSTNPAGIKCWFPDDTIDGRRQMALWQFAVFAEIGRILDAETAREATTTDDEERQAIRDAFWTVFHSTDGDGNLALNAALARAGAHRARGGQGEEGDA